jgi:hypothetical protein
VQPVAYPASPHVLQPSGGGTLSPDISFGATAERLQSSLALLALPQDCAASTDLKQPIVALEQLGDRLNQPERGREKVERLKAFLHLCRSVKRQGECLLRKGGARI